MITQKIKQIITSFAALAMLVLPSLAVTPAFAVDISNNLCSGTNVDISGGTATGCDPNDAGNSDSLNTLLTNAVNIFSAIVGVIAVIMIIVGGLRYITSGGDQNKVASAKNTLMYAIIGLIVVALAQLIVHFVLQKANTLA
jgi:cytochrome bd-type quinol oxidase subunit 2